MKVRPSQWLNQETMQPMFGIEVHYMGQWINASQNGTPLLFADINARDAKMAEIKKSNYAKEDQFNTRVAKRLLDNYRQRSH